MILVQRVTKSTNELCIGDFIAQSGQDILLKVVGKTGRRNVSIQRLEGHYSGTVFSAGQQLGRHWDIIPTQEAKERIANQAEAMLMAMVG